MLRSCEAAQMPQMLEARTLWAGPLNCTHGILIGDGSAGNADSLWQAKRENRKRPEHSFYGFNQKSRANDKYTHTYTHVNMHSHTRTERLTNGHLKRIQNAS